MANMDTDFDFQYDPGFDNEILFPGIPTLYPGTSFVTDPGKISMHALDNAIATCLPEVPTICK